MFANLSFTCIRYKIHHKIKKRYLQILLKKEKMLVQVLCHSDGKDKISSTNGFRKLQDWQLYKGTTVKDDRST